MTRFDRTVVLNVESHTRALRDFAALLPYNVTQGIANLQALADRVEEMAGEQARTRVEGIVGDPVEYALYALAIREPELFVEAEQFSGGMLANDTGALERVRAMRRAAAYG
jgi:hypothetical protein